MTNIVIFGIGETYRRYKKFFKENKDKIKIVAFLDNNLKFQGEEKDGAVIYIPEDVKNLVFDGILILSPKYGKEMTEQLLALGVKQESIWNFNTLKLTALKGKRTQYGTEVSLPQNKGRVLVLTSSMGFHGGSMAAVHAARILQSNGYDVMLSAPDIHEKLLKEIVQEGLKITIIDCLPYMCREDLDWVCHYDVVIVNVFLMMNCAYEISKIRPVLWWIHEDRSIWRGNYQGTREEFTIIDRTDWMNRVDVVGVSQIAQEAFNYFYPNIIQRILPFGIPDQYKKEYIGTAPKSKVIFAVMAGFYIYKGQSVLVEAAKRLSQQEKDMMEIWFIGPEGQNLQELKDICEEKDNIKFWGLLPHQEIIRIFPQIDVVICPSLIETMSLTIVEGMMFEKLCITTDMTGIAEYIDNGNNGFVVKAGDPDQLAERMAWIINNREQWEPIKRNARKTFEEKFTLEKFGERLEVELKNCRKEYYENFSNVSASIS